MQILACDLTSVKEKERETRGNATFAIIMTALFESRQQMWRVPFLDTFVLDSCSSGVPSIRPTLPPSCYFPLLLHRSLSFAIPLRSFQHPIFLVITYIFARNEKGMGCRSPPKKKRKRFIIDSSIEREIPQNELILKIERDIVSSTIGLVSVCYPSLRLIVRIRWNTTTNQWRDKSNKLSNLSINYLYKIKW